jgi:hypothetical protein
VWNKLALPVVLLMLTGCRTTTPTAVTDTSCLAFEPITWSSKDTSVTHRQIRQHNAAFRSLCGK